MANDTGQANADAQAMLAMLERWKEDNQRYAALGTKPKMVVINTSGGGLRSMLWTFRCLQVADSLLDGSLMDRTVLMTGSSGGLIGATYYRQLFLADQNSTAPHRNDQALLGDLSHDMLNPIFFSFVTNDLMQRTLGISRDDAGKFLGSYVEQGIFAKDPFQTLDTQGVGALVELAKDRGRATRPGLHLGKHCFTG